MGLSGLNDSGRGPTADTAAPAPSLMPSWVLLISTAPRTLLTPDGVQLTSAAPSDWLDARNPRYPRSVAGPGLAPKARQGQTPR